MKFIDTENTQPLHHIFAFLSRDENGNEGILGAESDFGMFPMLTGDMRIVDMMRPAVIDMAKDMKQKFYLVKFSNKIDLEVIDYGDA